MKKKIIAAALALTVLIGTGTTAFAAGPGRGRNQTGDRPSICQNVENCPNNGERPMDGTGRKSRREEAVTGTEKGENRGGGYANRSENCPNPEDCPNDGVAKRDGTGQKWGNNKANQGRGQRTGGCPMDGTGARWRATSK